MLKQKNFLEQALEHRLVNSLDFSHCNNGSFKELQFFTDHESFHLLIHNASINFLRYVFQTHFIIPFRFDIDVGKRKRD
jgi:hypothetical protein